MSLWWLEPGWKDALCANCGVNIWKSGGDPDHGVCFDCFFQTAPEQHYLCEICLKGEACTSTNGYAVCSPECDHIAQNKETK